MEETDWDAYGTGNYEKCADCMVHSGFEATAVSDTVTRPWKALAVALRGVKTEGPMAPDIPLEGQRPAVYVFDKQRHPEAVRDPQGRGRGKGPEEGRGSGLAPGTRPGCREPPRRARRTGRESGRAPERRAAVLIAALGIDSVQAGAAASRVRRDRRPRAEWRRASAVRRRNGPRSGFPCRPPPLLSRGADRALARGGRDRSADGRDALERQRALRRRSGAARATKRRPRRSGCPPRTRRHPRRG